jgi:hypothetical protein
VLVGDKNMKSSSVFLLVPLLCASLAFSALPPQQSSVAQAWRQSERTDPVRGDYTRFNLPGKFLKASAGDDSVRPSLVVDCSTHNRSGKPKFVRGTLVVGDPLKIDWVEPEEIHGISYFPKVNVVYRLDDAKEEREEWPAGSDKSSASFSKSSLEKMLHAHTLEINARDKSGSQLVMQFDMPDPTLVEQGCDVDLHKK